MMMETVLGCHYVLVTLGPIYMYMYFHDPSTIQVVLPALLEQGHTRSWLKAAVTYWSRIMSSALGLRSYLIGDVPLVQGDDGIVEGDPGIDEQVRLGVLSCHWSWWPCHWSWWPFPLPLFKCAFCHCTFCHCTFCKSLHRQWFLSFWKEMLHCLLKMMLNIPAGPCTTGW